MTFFEICAILTTLAAAGGYINERFMSLPSTIGHMVFALVVSLIMVGLGRLGVIDFSDAAEFVGGIDFSEVLLHGMLSFLLFAGAMHINLAELRDVKWPVFILATVGVMIATFVTAAIVWQGAAWCGFDLPFIYALLFGALISPTDPIAVLSILKQVGASRRLYIKIGGESLFNDGVGVVVFLTILGIVNGQGDFSWAATGTRFLTEAVGGLALGGVIGWVTYRLLRSIDNYKVEVLLTLALVVGGYAFAETVHVSAPIAMVVAGLIIGNQGRSLGMSDTTREHLDIFWELIDEILNAILFMLVGLEVILISVGRPEIVLGAVAIVAVLAARWISVVIPVSVLGKVTSFEKGTVVLMTWGGLRGGLSIAMALSLPPGPIKEMILPVTYIVVLFSILVQGLTFRHVLKFVSRGEKEAGG
jgi:CPA1 family monovalent cation:H+ antiporter